MYWIETSNGPRGGYFGGDPETEDYAMIKKLYDDLVESLNNPNDLHTFIRSCRICSRTYNVLEEWNR